MMKAATAIIDTDALSDNIAKMRTMTPNTQLWAMVKANGYGHGLLPVARALSANADGFGVARLDEALLLRAGGIVNPILLVEGFCASGDVATLLENNLETVVHTTEQIEALERCSLTAPLTVWLKIDTGMHRLGFHPEDVSEMIARLHACDNVAKPLHFISHFGRADEPDNPITLEQIALFSQLTMNQAGCKSIAASSGCLLWPTSHFDTVRPGIVLYGISPLEQGCGAELGFTPVMTMASSLIAVRRVKKGESVGYGGCWTAPQDSILGVVAIGYGDGYPRLAPNGTPVLVNGRRVPIVGRVSMDMLTVDLGADAKDDVGDEVILWGAKLPVEEVARHIGTIGYELVTNITSRVALIYR